MRYCTNCALRDRDSSGIVSYGYIPIFSPGRMEVCRVRCLGRIGSPSKSRRQKIHGIEYVEIRLGLSAESCAGSPIFNVGETMFWSVSVGIDHDARCRRALSGHGSRFYLTGEIVTPPRCPHHLFYTWILYVRTYIAVIYATQIDMTFNSFSLTKYYRILKSTRIN